MPNLLRFPCHTIVAMNAGLGAVRDALCAAMMQVLGCAEVVAEQPDQCVNGVTVGRTSVGIKLTDVQSGYEDEEVEIEVDAFMSLFDLRRTARIFLWKKTELLHLE